MNLYSFFLANTGNPIHKNVHYFPIYERHFQRFVGRPVTMIEIGVGGGGSSQMWKRYFGPHARIIGLDINPACKKFEDSQVSVRIGDQSESAFLADVLREFGTPDIVLDDGSHQMDHVNKTFTYLYPKLYHGGVYLVEDLHTAYWDEFGGGLNRPGTFMERCKSLVDELNVDHSRGKLTATEFSDSTSSMHFYDSIVVFERGRALDRRSVIIGNSQTY